MLGHMVLGKYRVSRLLDEGGMSKIYLAYCSCTRPGGVTMNIAACFTQGASDFLFVGRHGIFYDRQGRDWDAVITSLVDNPISLRQAQRGVQLAQQDPQRSHEKISGERAVGDPKRRIVEPSERHDGEIGDADTGECEHREEGEVLQDRGCHQEPPAVATSDRPTRRRSGSYRERMSLR